MRIVFITAGAAGMYCGSCMKDNTLVAQLVRDGHDAQLLPTYTPIRTDEEDISSERIFFGGINIYLEQSSWLFRHTPWFVDRLFNFPRLLRWISRLAMRTQGEKLGALTLSMLRGDDGKQRKEIDKLLDYLQRSTPPDVILISNVLLSGMVPHFQRTLSKPIIAFLQGDDIFLESLPKDIRADCLRLIRENARSIDCFIASSHYYADFMAEYLGVARTKIEVVYPGLNLSGWDMPAEVRASPPYVIGYFARICPEKGLHNLVDAYCLLNTQAGVPENRLKISGWLGEHNRGYLNAALDKLKSHGLNEKCEYISSPDRHGKIAFFRSLDILSVPTTYREPKGLYILEALANGVPVVQPAHGSFPELLEATHGGLIVPPGDTQALAEGLRHLLDNAPLRQQYALNGAQAVRERFTAKNMASSTIEILKRFVG